VCAASRDVKTGGGCAVPLSVMTLLTAKQQECHTIRTEGGGRLVLSILHTALIKYILPPFQTMLQPTPSSS
jgi:hypothetical protein